MAKKTQTGDKFTFQQKKKLAKNIGKLSSENDYKKLFKLVEDDGVTYTINNNGIFFDINLLNEETLYKIDDLIKLSINNKEEELVYNSYIPYTKEEFSEYHKTGINLSKEDKIVINKCRFNNINNEDSEYSYCEYNASTFSDSDTV